MFRRWRLKREVRRLPPLTTATPEGTLVRVSGRVRVLDSSLVGPSTGRPGVAFRVRIWFAGRGGWDAFAREPFTISEVCPFALDVDGGETVIVDGDGSHVLIGLRDSTPFDTKDERERIKAFRERHRLPKVVMSFDESVVEPGAVVCVAGIVVRDPRRPGQDTGFRHEPPPQTRIIGDAARRLRIVPALD